MICMLFFFFFSSRRRHTRFDCDWSSDVCSSDLRSASALRLDCRQREGSERSVGPRRDGDDYSQGHERVPRSEEHTSELQSQSNLVCRLLLEKKKKKNKNKDKK